VFKRFRGGRESCVQPLRWRGELVDRDKRADPSVALAVYTRRRGHHIAAGAFRIDPRGNHPNGVWPIRPEVKMKPTSRGLDQRATCSLQLTATLLTRPASLQRGGVDVQNREAFSGCYAPIAPRKLCQPLADSRLVSRGLVGPVLEDRPVEPGRRGCSRYP